MPRERPLTPRHSEVATALGMGVVVTALCRVQARCNCKRFDKSEATTRKAWDACSDGALSPCAGGNAMSASTERSGYSFRHTLTSIMANAGVPVEVRQKFTGHASAEVNQHYTRHEIATLRAAIEKLPALTPSASGGTDCIG
jgi:integrase